MLYNPQNVWIYKNNDQTVKCIEQANLILESDHFIMETVL